MSMKQGIGSGQTGDGKSECRHFAAADAKSLQLCLTLCDPTDGSPPGSYVHGIFQAGVLEWGAIAFSGRSSTAPLKMSLPPPRLCPSGVTTVALVMASGWVPYSGCNKVPQTHLHKAISLAILRFGGQECEMSLIGLKSRCQQGRFLLGAPGQSPWLFSFWWSPAFLCLWPYHSSFHFHRYLAFSSAIETSYKDVCDYNTFQVRLDSPGSFPISIVHLVTSALTFVTR